MQGWRPTLGGLYQLNVTVPSDLTTGTYYLDIAGPDSYTSEATMAVGTATPASATGRQRQSAAAARGAAAENGAASQAQGFDDAVHIGAPHAHVFFHPRGCGAFVECLEQRQLGHGVAFGGGKRAIVSGLPAADGCGR